MARLSKQQSKLHNEACELLKKDILTYDEKMFIFENWQESAHHLNSVAGAFFTPQPLAREMSIEVPTSTTRKTRIIDLCGGIGALSFALINGYCEKFDVTIVEINPEYVAVGRKLVPEATWIVGDVLDLPPDLKGFDCAISNPPFGRIESCRKKAPRYTGAEFDYKVADVASDIADHGVFLLPQGSCPFKYSGRRGYEAVLLEKYEKFTRQTGIEIKMNCGIDTTQWEKDPDNQGSGWHGVSVITEIACMEFSEARENRSGKFAADVEAPVSAPLHEEELTVAVAAMAVPDSDEESALADAEPTPEPLGTPVQQELFSLF